jgi:hypothetical protein
MNTSSIRFLISSALALAVVAVAAAPGSAIDGETYGVYQYVVKQAEGTIDEISAAITGAAEGAGWSVAGTVDSADPEHCDFMSRVMVLYDAKYADAVIAANPETGAWAALDRVNIFQDEEGTHVSVVNPLSIDRTVLMNDTDYMDMARKHLDALRAMILSAVNGTESSAQYGELRTGGKIDKTMGVVAGGDFSKLIRDKFKVKKGGVTAVGQAIALGFKNEKTGKWGLHLVYQVNVAGRDVYIVGVSGSPMDTKSFEIVGGGQNEKRKDYACPGLSHAGAYPIEIVVQKDKSGEIKIRMVDTMYRMKMYFEDAGTTAFMKNMRMPGSIENEIEKQIKKALED